MCSSGVKSMQVNFTECQIEAADFGGTGSPPLVSLPSFRAPLGGDGLMGRALSKAEIKQRLCQIDERRRRHWGCV